MVKIEVGALGDVSEGWCLLTPSGLLPAVDFVEWAEDEEDDDGQVTVYFDDDSQATGPEMMPIHSVAAEEAAGVTADQLAAAPEPTWTIGIGESIQERVDAAWAAHLAGDVDRVVALTEPLLAESFTGNYNHWSPIESGLALLAFELHRRGDQDLSAQVAARLDVEGFDPAKEKMFRDILQRHLSSPLDELPDLRLRAVVLRWARGGAPELTRADLEQEHAEVVKVLKI